MLRASYLEGVSYSDVEAARGVEAAGHLRALLLGRQDLHVLTEPQRI